MDVKSITQRRIQLKNVRLYSISGFRNMHRIIEIIFPSSPAGRNGRPPYQARRRSLILKSYLNLCSFDNTHPAKNAVKDTFIFDYYKKDVKQKPFSLTANDVLSNIYISVDSLYSYKECPYPPWQVEKPHDLISKQDLPHLILSESNILIDSQYSDYLKNFTDGSKDLENNTAGCAFVVPEL